MLDFDSHETVGYVWDSCSGVHEVGLLCSKVKVS